MFTVQFTYNNHNAPADVREANISYLDRADLVGVLRQIQNGPFYVRSNVIVRKDGDTIATLYASCVRRQAGIMADSLIADSMSV